mgnify:CR=1 FL=1
MFRGDYPHDSYWTEVSICFSDGETIKVATTDTLEFQSFCFPEKMTSSVTLKNLKKAEDTSPFPALTQIEIFGQRSNHLYLIKRNNNRKAIHYIRESALKIEQ